MAARRIIYLTLLILAVALHLAYGQYVTFFMVIFLLLVPILSLIASIPSALSVRTYLKGGGKVTRGRASSVSLAASHGEYLPPDAVRMCVESRNVFTGKKTTHRNVRISGANKDAREFNPDTTQIGTVRFSIKRAFIFDRLGLIPIPVKRGGSVSVTVMPDKEKPVPEPGLVDLSVGTLKPKPHSFSEEHELRPYRDGDPMNLVHWKISRKMDDIIVREPQELTRKKIVLVIDQPEHYESHKSVLEQLCYLHELLFANEIPYMLHYGRKRIYIDSENEFNDFLEGVLAEPMKAEKAMSPQGGLDTIVYYIKPRRGIFE